MSIRPVAVIPAHLSSVRFPRKILFEIRGLPMIEHVRRRALMARNVERVIVATCDEEIATVVRSHGGEVVMTSSTHRNGTTRVAEAVAGIDCSHVVLVQGDEPLLLPAHLEQLVAAVEGSPDVDAWNATGPIDDPSELDRHSFVKCAVASNDRILYCFRRSPGYAEFDLQRAYVRKILGLMAYRTDVLANVTSSTPSRIEEAEFIEQLRLLEHGYHLASVPVASSIPSINEPGEVDAVLNELDGNLDQRRLLAAILG